MSINKYLVEQICKKYKITDYLASKGIQPTNRQEHRIAYCCPLHDDKHPSFMVYWDENICENYFCFGCNRSGNLVSLYAALEHLSWEQVIEVLGRGISVSSDHRLDVTIEELKKQIETKNIDNAKNFFGEISLQVSCMGFNHMNRTNFDVEERDLLEKLYKKIDDMVDRLDVNGLKVAYDFISGDNCLGKNVFEYRMQKWIEREEKETYKILKAETIDKTK